MPLSTLLAGMADTARCASISVRGLTLDSRAVTPGVAFVALRGQHHHGLEFAPEAVRRGAGVMLAETPLPAASPAPVAGVPVFAIDDLAHRLSTIAARWYGAPGEALRIVGVTGTNGKTSTVQFIATALEALGHPAGSIGTLGMGRVGHLAAGERTTPDAITVQGDLAALRAGGARFVAMEASSHALVQGRVEAVPFEVAAFTNLTRDHLDYHGTMAAYGAAKARLFAFPGLRAAAINVDDAFGRQLAGGLRKDIRLLRYAIDAADAELRATAIVSHDNGIDFQLATPWGNAPIHTHLLGRFNVANLLAVTACLGALGIAFDDIVRVLPTLTPVPGRMNRVGGGAQPLLVVDYAHTPDALVQALTTLRPHTRGKLVCVFGAGGDRDHGKRPEMGRIVEQHADIMIVTDDNPRSEDGGAIVNDILAGMRVPARAIVERDRARAIARAVALCSAGDVVLIAGKGHETYQEVAGHKHPFDDLAVAHRVLGEALPC